MRDDRQAVWVSEDTDGKSIYLAVFNLADEGRCIVILPEEAEIPGISTFDGIKFEELWSGDITTGTRDGLKAAVPAHGARLFRLTAVD